MNNHRIALRMVCVAMGCGLLLSSLAVKAHGHCDTESGPVAIAASKALQTGKFETVAIWVAEAQSQELQERFQECLSVYQMRGEAKKMAERYFMETAVRLHREAEGMSYTGLKPPQPLPQDVAEAEKALETGNVKPLTNLLSRELQQETQKWFRRALEARKLKDKSIRYGREWVDAYVKYVIYVHGLHKTIQAGPTHGVSHPE